MKRIVALLTFFALALALAACGSSEPPTPAPTTITIEGSDSFAFSPASFSAATGSAVTITFKNGGGLDHNVVVVPGDKDPLTVTEADGLPGMSTGTVSGGQEKQVTFTAPAAGSYKYVCTIPGHAAGGMVGTLTITN